MRRFLWIIAVVMVAVSCSRERGTKPERRDEAAVERIEIREIDPQKRHRRVEEALRHERSSASAKTVSRRVTPADNLTTESSVESGKLYIRGRVVNEEGAPLRELKVVLFEKVQLGNRKPVTVQQDGRFQVEVDPQVTCRLMATAEGFAPAVTDDIVLHDQSIDDVVLSLTRGRSISGIVTNHEGKPVRKATISVMPASNHPLGQVIYEPSLPTNDLKFLGRGESDDEGHFTIQAMPAKLKLDVAAEHDWYAHPALYRLDENDTDTTGLEMKLPASGVFEGIVVSKSGERIAGAEVVMHTQENLAFWKDRAESDPLGRFKISPAPLGSTGTLAVKADGFYDFGKTVAFSDTPVTITLEQEQFTTVTVRCLDAETRQLVTSASVSAAGEGAKRATKLIYDVEPGVFRIRHQKKRELSVYAEAEGYIGASSHDRTSDEDEQEITFLLRKDVLVTGRVIDGVTLQPVARAEFSAGGGRSRFATSASDGRFEFQAHRSGESYWVKTTDGRESDQLLFQLPLGGVLDVGDVRVWGKNPLTIQVVNAADNQPIPGAQVEVHQGGLLNGAMQESGLTDHQGQFKAEASARESVRIKLPEWNLEKTAQPPVTADNWKIMIPVGGGQLQGRLLWNGKPIAGRVQGEHTDIAGLGRASVHTGSEGWYKLDNLTPGQWSISALATSGQVATTRLEVQIPSASAVVERDIELASDDSIVRGRVLNAKGEPVAGARVTIVTTGADGGVETEQDGSFETWPVDPKNCQLQALHEEGRSDTVRVQPPAEGGETAPVILTLKQGTGRIVCEVVSIVDGLPISAAKLELEKDGKTYASTYQLWGVDKPLVIENLPAGDYRLHASASGYSESVRDVTVSDGETVERLEILSPALRISISVVDVRGYLVKGATVMLIPLDQNSVQPVLQKTTDERGSVQFSNVAPGTYQVEVSAEGGSAAGTIEVRHQREVELQLVLGEGK